VRRFRGGQDPSRAAASVEHADVLTPRYRQKAQGPRDLLRQYFPKRHSLARLRQHHCDLIVHKLNSRPRKRYGYKTPLERIEELCGALHFEC